MYITSETIMGYLKKETTTDKNIRDIYIMFGKREYHLTKGLFVGLKSNGKFYIDHQSKVSRITLIYENDGYHNEFYTVNDEIVHLKNDIVYPERNYSETLIRTYPENVPGTLNLQIDQEDTRYYTSKMILYKKPEVIPDYQISIDESLFKANQNYSQLQGVSINLVGFS